MKSSGIGGAAAAILKYLLLAAFIAALLPGLAGARVSGASFEAVTQAVLAAATTDGMSEGDNQMLRRLYKLDPDAYEGALLYYPSSLMGVEELLVVKLADVAQQDEVVAAAEARRATQRNTFESYGPEQVALLDRSVIEARGNFVLFVVAENPGTIRDAFINAL